MDLESVKKHYKKKQKKNSCLILQCRLLKIATLPVLSTSGNDNSKSRYGNDLKFVMAFLDR